MTFDFSKKNEKDLILIKRVQIRLHGKYVTYFMTNDFSYVSTQLKALGCNMPDEKDFIENTTITKKIPNRMNELNVIWALGVTTTAILHYLDKNTGKIFTVDPKNLSSKIVFSTLKRLTECIFQNKYEEIKDIVNAGFDINQYYGYSLNALLVASILNSYNSVKAIVELNADVNTTDQIGITPLMFTTEKDGEQSAKILLSRKEIEIDKKNYDGATALIMAIQHGSLKVLKLLIEAGADINIVDNNGENALIKAIIKKDYTCATYLIKSGANINYSDKYGRTPLIIASEYNDLIMVETLIDKEVDISKKDNNGNSAFIIAAINNNFRIVKFLWMTNKISEKEIIQSLIKAAMNDCNDSVKTIIELSKQKKEIAFIALIAGCYSNKINIVKSCLEYDCDIDEGHYLGITPLMVACCMNNIAIVDLLIENNVDINKSDEEGKTALMYAASKSNQEIIRLLLRNGANKDSKDKFGKTYEDYLKVFDSRNYSQLIFDRLKLKMSKTEINRNDNIPKKNQPFIERLDWYIKKYQERFPDKPLYNIWKDGGLSPKHWNKIQKKINIEKNTNYHPDKDTVIKLAKGLVLTLNEAEDLLISNGNAFADNERDSEIKKLFCEQNYNLFIWNDRIYELTGKIFFEEVIESEKEFEKTRILR